MSLPFSRRISFLADALRFIAAGGLNTLATLALYQLLLFLLPHHFAYSLAWATGFVAVVLFYPAKVFPGGNTSVRAKSALGASYFVTYALGLGLLELLVRYDFGPRLAIILVMTVTTIIGFLAARRFMRPSK